MPNPLQPTSPRTPSSYLPNSGGLGGYYLDMFTPKGSGMPGQYNYLLQFLQMFPGLLNQGGSNGLGQTVNNPLGDAQTQRMAGQVLNGAFTPKGGLKDYLQDPTNRAQQLSAGMGGSYGGMSGGLDVANRGNYMGILQALLGVNPIQYGR